MVINMREKCEKRMRYHNEATKREEHTVVQQFDEDYLDEIASEIDKEAEWAEEYECSHEDSSTAEYVASLGYGEADTDDIIRVILKEIDEQGLLHEQTYAALKDALKDADSSTIIDLVAANGELESHHGLRCIDGSVYSMSVGERHWEFSEELQAKIDKLNGDQWEYVSGRTNNYCSRDGVCVGSDYDSWHWVVDVESIIESLNITIEL